MNLQHFSIKNLDGSLISHYRSALMGFAIIGVLYGHFFSLSGITHNSTILAIFDQLYMWVHTRGFFFLSGLGLYYSFVKNNGIKAFYLRRVQRLLMPFLLMTFPYFVFQDIFYNPDFFSFFGHLTTVSYWIDGNYNGLWYVAASMFLYAIFPLIYKLLFWSNSFIHISISFAFMLTVVISINQLIGIFYNDYFIQHDLFFFQYFMFLIGIYCAYLVNLKQVKYLISMIVLTICFWLLQRVNTDYTYLYFGMKTSILYIPIISITLYFFDLFSFLSFLKKMLEWCGRYTLELYILQSIIFCFLSRMRDVLNIDYSLLFCISVAEIFAFILCVPIHSLVTTIVIKLALIKSE